MKRGCDKGRHLLTHGGDDGDHQVLAIVETSLELLANVVVVKLDIVLGVSVTVHQVEEALEREYGLLNLAGRLTYISNVENLVFGSPDVGDIHVVGLASALSKLISDRNSRKERYLPSSCQ